MNRADLVLRPKKENNVMLGQKDQSLYPLLSTDCAVNEVRIKDGRMSLKATCMFRFGMVTS